MDKRYRRNCNVSMSIDRSSKNRVLTLSCKTEWSQELFRSVEVNAYRERMEDNTFIVVFHDIKTLFHFEKDSIKDLERFANHVDCLLEREQEDDDDEEEENVDSNRYKSNRSNGDEDEEEVPQKKGDFRRSPPHKLKSTTTSASTTRKVSATLIPLRPSAKKC